MERGYVLRWTVPNPTPSFSAISRGRSGSAHGLDLRLIDVGPRAAELLAFGLRIPQAGSHALLNQGPFKFGHDTDDLKHQAAGGIAQVQVVAKTDKGYSERFQLSDRVDQVAQGTLAPIEFPDEHGIKLPPAGIGHQLVQCGTGVFRTSPPSFSPTTVLS